MGIGKDTLAVGGFILKPELDRSLIAATPCRKRWWRCSGLPDVCQAEGVNLIEFGNDIRTCAHDIVPILRRQIVIEPQACEIVSGSSCRHVNC
jgi:hypothetical protein